MKKTIAIVLGSLTLGLGVVGIAVAAYDNESSEEAKADFCESLTDLSSTVMSYEGIDLRTATTDELDAAADDIENSWDEVVDDAADWAYADDNELYDAYSDLYWAIDGLDGDLTVAESVDELEEELNAFPEAFRATFDGSGCTTTAA